MFRIAFLIRRLAGLRCPVDARTCVEYARLIMAGNDPVVSARQVAGDVDRWGYVHTDAADALIRAFYLARRYARQGR